jgi:hypothetical protein
MIPASGPPPPIRPAEQTSPCPARSAPVCRWPSSPRRPCCPGPSRSPRGNRRPPPPGGPSGRCSPGWRPRRLLLPGRHPGPAGRRRRHDGPDRRRRPRPSPAPAPVGRTGWCGPAARPDRQYRGTRHRQRGEGRSLTGTVPASPDGRQGPRRRLALSGAPPGCASPLRTFPGPAYCLTPGGGHRRGADRTQPLLHRPPPLQPARQPAGRELQMHHAPATRAHGRRGGVHQQDSDSSDSSGAHPSEPRRTRSPRRIVRHER